MIAGNLRKQSQSKCFQYIDPRDVYANTHIHIQWMKRDDVLVYPSPRVIIVINKWMWKKRKECEIKYDNKKDNRGQCLSKPSK